MACYHPLRAFDIGLLTDKYKPKYKICGPNVDRIHASYNYVRNGEIKRSIRQVWQDRWITEWTPIPCGQCIGCRLDYSRMWADRCILEAQQYENNAFITLTYDDEHLPKPEVVTDVNTGELFLWPSLNFEHLVDFIEKLRDYYKYHYNWKYEEHEVQPGEDYDRYDKKSGKYFKVDNPGIRFYSCGEYGGESGRPHYHVLAFNMPPLPDMKYWFTNHEHEKIFYSEILRDEIWRKRGIVSIGEVSWNSAAYVARYVVKKQKGNTAGLVELPGNRLVTGLVAEDTRMSRRPGIAWKYYDSNKEKFYETDEIVISVRGKVRTIKPPRYFDKLYDIDCEDPFKMQEIKERRAESARLSMKYQLEKTTLNEEEYLGVKERNKIAQVNALKRKMKGGVM